MLIWPSFVVCKLEKSKIEQVLGSCYHLNGCAQSSYQTENSTKLCSIRENAYLQKYLFWIAQTWVLNRPPWTVPHGNTAHKHTWISATYSRVKKSSTTCYLKKKQKIVFVFLHVSNYRNTHGSVKKNYGNTFLSSLKLSQVSLGLDINRKRWSVFQKRGVFWGRFIWMILIIQLSAFFLSL